ncbi:4'-phosphopantetheinyl transferase superfamily protein [uncultured Flavobacterium sp.]|uniref:4'-phosphopantetheinyl transferase family protein n=1 Tax=uncultured Flavobacterium sp. TaxID=165435 RepID=UPI0030CA1873|tara:strand:- start:318 stop:797 length:480 start_codon:yes stop_codon:yes gene_type:complete
MIGNDVVDLSLAKKESNWKRKGFLTKIFTPFEQNLIHNAIHQEQMVWMLWSIKESSYKAYQRIHYNQGYYPSKIEILSLNTSNDSVIKLFEVIFYGETCIHNNVIKTVVVQNKVYFNSIIKSKNINYYKDTNGLPLDTLNNKPISISHHGVHKEIISLK